MNLKLIQILFGGCLLLECNFAFSQGRGSIQTTNNIFISNIKHIDTVYCISNPKVRSQDVRREIFANQACFWFKTDSLYKPKQFGEAEFAKNFLDPHSFFLLASTTFIQKIILPEIKDTALYHRVDKSYCGEWECVVTSKRIHKGWNYKYGAYTYNTNTYLAVFIKAELFNIEYNKIINPPKYLFPEESKDNDIYIQLMIPLLEEYENL